MNFLEISVVFRSIVQSFWKCQGHSAVDRREGGDSWNCPVTCFLLLLFSNCYYFILCHLQSSRQQYSIFKLSPVTLYSLQTAEDFLNSLSMVAEGWSLSNSWSLKKRCFCLVKSEFFKKIKKSIFKNFFEVIFSKLRTRVEILATLS